jgi:hypothetical protein
MLRAHRPVERWGLRLLRLKDEGKASPVMVSLAKRANVAGGAGRWPARRGPSSGRTASPTTFRRCGMRSTSKSVLTYEGTHEVHTLVLGKAITGIGRVRIGGACTQACECSFSRCSSIRVLDCTDGAPASAPVSLPCALPSSLLSFPSCSAAPIQEEPPCPPRPSTIRPVSPRPAATPTWSTSPRDGRCTSPARWPSTPRATWSARATCAPRPSRCSEISRSP